MRVGIDAREVRLGLGGVGRYALNLLLGLSLEPSDLEFTVFYNDPAARKIVDRYGGPYRGRFQWVKSRVFTGGVGESLEFAWLLRVHGLSLFHDVSGAGVNTLGVPTVLTVHELANREPSKDLRRAVQRAKTVIAVSNTLAQEVESLFNVSMPKIRVITNAVSPRFLERVPEDQVRVARERFSLKQPYFFCVTSARVSKNHELILRAVQESQRFQDYVFVFTLPQAKGLENHPNFRFLDKVEDAWMCPLYAAAEAVIVPSLYEGFSLPPIESLSMETLPVVSRIGVHEEVLGNILPPELFFDPKDPVEFLRALEKRKEGGDSMRTAALEKFKLVKPEYSVLNKSQAIQNVYRGALA